MAWNIEFGVTIDLVTLPETNCKNALKIGLWPQEKIHLSTKHEFLGANMLPLFQFRTLLLLYRQIWSKNCSFFLYFSRCRDGLFFKRGECWVLPTRLIAFTEPGVVRGWWWRCYEMLTHGNHKSKFRFRCGDCGLFVGVLYGWCLVCCIICMMFEDSTVLSECIFLGLSGSEKSQGASATHPQ